MVCVFPGCAEVRASALRFIRALIRDDFPTFDFPANATSGYAVSGTLLVIPQTISKLTFLITSIFLKDTTDFSVFMLEWKQYILFHLMNLLGIEKEN